MSTELERDINEIKISVARIDERLKVFDNHVVVTMEHEKRLRILEEFKAKLYGWSAAIGAIAGTISAIFIKLL